MIVIKEVKDRKVLNEGRDSNMGFALLKKIKPNEYETVNPISPCKDYLAEVVFTEITGIGTLGCGLKYPTKLNIFRDNKVYLTILIQKSMYNTYNGIVDFEKDNEWLKNNYKKLQTLINKFEDILELGDRTIIEEAKNNHYLITLPIDWINSTYSISLVTLLIRAGQVYNGEDSIESFIDNYPKDKIDSSLIANASSNIKLILETKKLPILPMIFVNQAKDSKFWSPHGLGICAWDKSYKDPFILIEDEQIVELTK